MLYSVSLNLTILILSLGGWGKLEIKDQLSPAESETGAKLGNKTTSAPSWGWGWAGAELGKKGQQQSKTSHHIEPR